MKVFAYCKSDIGTMRKVNQDSADILYYTGAGKKAVLSVVCDGVGGLQNGEYASREVLKSLSGWFCYEYPQIKCLASNEIEEMMKIRMIKSLCDQNDKIYAYGKRNQIELGTTATALLLEAERYRIIHVGDSRVYEITDEIVQLTEDQSYLAREVRRGNMTAEQAENDKRKNVLLQSVGYKNHLEPSFYTGKTKKATYLVCTDGFFRRLKKNEIAMLGPKFIINNKMLKKQVDNLIELSKKREERDNLSAAVIVLK